MHRLVERQFLQRLLNSFTTAANLHVSFTDVDGNCLLSSEQGESDFCKLIKSNSLGLARCRGSYARAGKEAAKWNEPYIFRCHAGLIAWVCPLLYRGNHIGNFVCGQVLMWEPEDFFWLEIQDLTRDLGPDSNSFVEAARRLKIVSAASVQAMADILYIVASYIAERGVGFLNYQKKLRNIGSWLWAENSKQNFYDSDGSENELKYRIFNLQSQIFREIMQMNPGEARNLLKKLVMEFFIQSKGQIEIIKGLCVEFISGLARLAMENGKKFEDTVKYGLLKFSELEDADTVEKVFLWLLTIGDYYINLLSQSAAEKQEKVINRVVGYIEQNYQLQDLSLKKVARAVYLSPTYLSRLFKKEKGMTLTDYINNIRVEKAKVLLRQNSQTIEDIARSVGFRDRSYFCRLFKKIVGISPTEYRSRIILTE
ncbi:MAG: AraC family transcriptional regulator [Firmicutes bacterium]|nr:AraC family transcriptional regulator [Bacillota bacterium]